MSLRASAERRLFPPLLWVGMEGPGDPWPSATAEPGPWWPRVIAPTWSLVLIWESPPTALQRVGAPGSPPDCPQLSLGEAAAGPVICGARGRGRWWERGSGIVRTDGTCRAGMALVWDPKTSPDPRAADEGGCGRWGGRALWQRPQCPRQKEPELDGCAVPPAAILQC